MCIIGKGNILPYRTYVGHLSPSGGCITHLLFFISRNICIWVTINVFMFCYQTFPCLPCYMSLHSIRVSFFSSSFFSSFFFAPSLICKWFRHFWPSSISYSSFWFSFRFSHPIFAFVAFIVLYPISSSSSSSFFFISLLPVAFIVLFNSSTFPCFAHCFYSSHSSLFFCYYS